ncbi:lysoplasmalogenase [uncultured Endozoicomonas sp.]|uniref:lysoplasmalogenase n=1 Tax=uncultured Endozoicomonas sp. TaxID=432652 RepID=UPI0026256079|nr:lysoplasmalogenase [uncultured Endozoicomonas sp.]
MSKRFTLAFWLLSLIYLVFMNAMPSALAVVSKAAPIFLLLVPVWSMLVGKLRTGMVIAIIFSAGGDIFLALDGVAGDFFVPGLGSFLIAQVTYAVLFWQRTAFNDRQRWWLAVLYIPVVAVLAWFILPASGQLMIPVTAYLLAISAMVLGAAFCQRPWQWLFLGASTFAISDSLIAINKFLYPLPYASLMIMVTYYLAQYMIVSGILKPETKARFKQ